MVTVLTRTIGPSGRDYASFTLAEADVTNIGTSADLVANDEAIVFEADAGTYDGLIFAWTLTTDATRNVTFKPAAGSEHGGVFGAGVILQDNTAVTSYIAFMANASTNNCVFDGIAFNVRSSAVSACSAIRSGVGHIWRNCLFSSEGTGSLNRSEDAYSSGSASAPIVYENCVTKGNPAYYFVSNKTGSSMRFVNCTHLTSERMFDFYTYAASSQAAEIVNCVNLGGGNNLQDAGPTATTITGSNNFGGSSQPFPAAIQGSPYPITATADTYNPGAAGDYALYDSTSGKLIFSVHNDVVDQGVGPSANSDVPTTDIAGNPRSGATANPGAFEELYVIAPTVLTRTIGASGRDYTSFTLAEADVANIGTTADLTNDNEAIVFEADAGTYSESVNIQSTLTTDATRQVTYKPAAGSEHNGDRTAGVIIEPSSGASLIARDDFTKVEFLVFAKGMAMNNDGCIADGCISIHNGTDAATVNGPAGTSAAPVVFENCVFEGNATRFGINLFSNSGDVTAKVVNCTFPSGGVLAGTGTGTTVTLDIVNSLVLASAGGDLRQQGAGTHILTGSNNFGPGSTNPFPAAIQGSPYPITATTDLNPGVGDWAIYDAATGAVIDDPDNDVLDGGVGPSVNSDVPTTDIAGVTRSGATTDPGAFVRVPAVTIVEPSSILTGENFTVPTVVPGPVSSTAVGIASGESFGSPQVLPEQLVDPTGIGSAEAVGVPGITTSVQIIAPSFIDGAEDFGTPSVGGLVTIVTPSFIDGAEDFGTPNIGQFTGLVPSGIASAEAFGTLRIVGGVPGVGVRIALQASFDSIQALDGGFDAAQTMSASV